MLKARSKIVVGSLAGAIAIHLAMLACSSGGGMMTALDGGARDAGGNDAVANFDTGVPATDGGFLDSVMDVVRDVVGEIVDAETTDAMANDGGADSGTTGCACPTLPTQPVTTFSFDIDLNDGAGSHPMTVGPNDMNFGGMTATPYVGSPTNPVVYQVVAFGSFTLPTLVGAGPIAGATSEFYQLECTLYVAPPATLLSSPSNPGCTLFDGPNNPLQPSAFTASGAGEAAMALESGFSVTSVTNEDVSFQISVAGFHNPSVTLTNIVFHTRSPSGGVLPTLQGAYVPPSS